MYPSSEVGVQMDCRHACSICVVLDPTLGPHAGTAGKHSQEAISLDPGSIVLEERKRL